MTEHARKAQFIGNLDPHSTFAGVMSFDVMGQLVSNVSDGLKLN